MSRIVCPKCRANNMPGQTNCFQCGSSLPPPEAVAPVFPPTAFPAAPARRTQPPNPVILAAVAVFVVLVLVAAYFVNGQNSALHPSHRQTQTALDESAELDQLRKAHGLGTGTAPANSGDDGTRQELNRLREKYGINTGNPHNPNDGSVPNGGATTFDQWRREHPDASNYQFH